MSSGRSGAPLYAITTLLFVLSVKGVLELLCLAVSLGMTSLGISAGVQGVSAERACQHNIQYSVANCSHRALQGVPWGLHHNLDTLDLSFNRFTTLPSMAFKSYANLRVLRMNNNAISSLHGDCLAKLDHLHTLDLAHNMFSAIPSEVLHTLPSLLRLNLAGNNLVLIQDEAFFGLSKLKVLDLSANRIAELQPNALLGLSYLQILKLEDNALRWLSPAVFQHLSPELLQLHLFNNPWLCDCKIRYMRQWIANGTASVWQQPGRTIRCDGPSLNRGKSLPTIPLDELACRVEMRTSGSRQAVARGQQVMMECIYFSIPDASPIWQKNQMPINFAAHPNKYIVTVEGSPVTTTRLYVRDFQYSDITEYECLAQNVRGSDSTIFKVTLKGIPFESVTHGPRGGSASPPGVNTKNVVIAVGVVCGIVLVIALSLLVFFCRKHIQRREQEKRDAVVESVKKHFLENEDTACTDSSVMNRSKLDQFNDTQSNSNRTNNSTTIRGKTTEIERYPKDREPTYTFQQPSSPFTNGNTYVSFSSEVMEPELFPLYPQPQGGKYEGPQTECKTPLLDRCTLSLSDADDSVDDAIQCHVYESISLYQPRHSHYSVASLTQGTRSTSFSPAHSSHPDYQDYREVGFTDHTGSSQKDKHIKRKSKSAGNLGLSTGEHIEMSSRDNGGSGQ